MPIRTIFAAIALLAVPMLARTAENDDFNPYKNAKVGDYATYKLNTKVAGNPIPGVITQSVIEKTEKEAKLKVVSSVNGMDIPGPVQTIDLTKPYDPTKGLPPGFEGTMKKVKDGKEKLKVMGKDYETNWNAYDLDGKISGMEIKASITVWFSKDIALGVAKIEMKAEIKSPNAETAKLETTKLEMTMEPTEAGNKKP
jgi:hypothetical protein